MNLTAGLPSLLLYFILFTRAPFRYRQTPTFGRDTIRCFSRNTLEMKRTAAHDFEDLLQVGNSMYSFGSISQSL